MFRKLLLAALLTGAPFASLSTHAADLKTWVLEGEDYPKHQGMRYFLDQLKIRSNGRYGGTVQWKETLGDQKKVLPQFQKGEVDVAVLSNTPLYQAVPEMEVLSLPFIFKNTDHMLRTLDGEIGQGLEKSLAAKGYIVLAWYDGGARSFFSRTKPLRFASDLNTMKIRVANKPELKRMASALGAEPIDMAYDKVKTALETGSIDGAENDLLSYQLSEQYKFAKYYVVSNHSVLPEAMVVSTQLWQKLSPADRELFRNTARESAIEVRNAWVKKTALVRKKLEKEGVKFYDMADNSGFVSRLRSVYTPVLSNPKSGELMLKVMTVGQTNS
ncbi:TRAP transporter substrate-binding protein DctP [Viridibacterium curvum]|uniref:TRAP transporter substrate-binding protein n=1 Tax=Viridibacterium curvum TaxID=1101404 RepID=A0ABP9QIM8_9RHOO